MESIEQIKTEFKPTGILNQNENLKELWNVEAATTTAPGNTKPQILTPAVIEQYYNGEEIPELTAAIESLTEYYIIDYFHYNDYLLVDSDIQVYLTSYYRRDDWKDNIRLEINANYNILLDKLPADAPDYFNIKSYEYTPYYRDEGDDALDFLTWSILEDNLEGTTWKDTITNKDITAAIAAQDQEHQEIIRSANYGELLEDIKNTYHQLIQEYLTEAQEALSEKFFEEVYLEALEAAEQETINQYYNKPIRSITP